MEWVAIFMLILGPVFFSALVIKTAERGVVNWMLGLMLGFGLLILMSRIGLEYASEGTWLSVFLFWPIWAIALVGGSIFLSIKAFNA
ncbi:MAG: hypothetical protein WA906_06105 [Pacificimonas sp.]